MWDLNSKAEETLMKQYARTLLIAAALTASSVSALAGKVDRDYDHSVNFSQYTSYSWGQVKTTNPFFTDRIKQAVDQQLQAKGWKLMPEGGAVTVFATDSIHNEQEVETMYDGLGGGWGGGWGWGRWGWGGGWGPGFGGTGMSTSTTVNNPVGTLVIDLFEGSSKKLLWRGLATEDLSSNDTKNTKQVDGDIAKMFKGFPPKAGK